MKNKLMIITLSTLLCAGAAQAYDRTKITNNTSYEVWYTWKTSNEYAQAAKNMAKKAKKWFADLTGSSTIKQAVTKSQYTMLRPNETFVDNHLNDALIVRVMRCQSDTLQHEEVYYDAKSNGYGNADKGLEIADVDGSIVVQPLK